MKLLVVLRQITARSGSSRKVVPPSFGSFLTTTSTECIAPLQLRRSLSQYSSVPLWPQVTGGLFPRPGALNLAKWSASSGELKCLAHSGKLSGLVFQRSIWGSGREWMWSSTKKDVVWLRPKRNPLWGGFGDSRGKNFGSGSYVDPQLALGALIAANVGVFFLWRSLGGRFMESNFVVSVQALKEGRVHTLVTSAFSQYNLHHLLSNMIGLYFFGSEIGNLFGGQKLILLYLAGGIVGSLSHVAYCAYVMPWLEGYPRTFSGQSPGALGASGAVNAIIILDILLFPTRIIYLNFIIPVPAALFGIFIIGSDLWASRNARENVTSGAGHLGGALMGILAWLRWR